MNRAARCADDVLRGCAYVSIHDVRSGPAPAHTYNTDTRPERETPTHTQRERLSRRTLIHLHSYVVQCSAHQSTDEPPHGHSRIDGRVDWVVVCGREYRAQRYTWDLDLELEISSLEFCMHRPYYVRAPRLRTPQRTSSGCGAHRLGFAGVSQSWKSTSEIAIS